MKVCDHCGFLIFEHNAPCSRCADEARLARGALLPQPNPSIFRKVLKWLLAGLALVALAATVAITWFISTVGESLRSLG